MWTVNSKSQQYEAVAADEAEVKVEGGFRGAIENSRRGRRTWVLAALLATVILLPLLIGAGYYIYQSSGHSDTYTEDASPEAGDVKSDISPPPSTRCKQRREWRTISLQDQQSYISAVLCLLSQPSILTTNSNQTTYSDFPRIHSHIGFNTHNSAPFLPWHRYFLHVYEGTQRSKCGYEGGLVYWDWTLHSEALEHSPVFDPAAGYGPFVGITAEYHDVKYQPHCLSRGFRDTEGRLGHIDWRDVSPESIGEVLALGSYEEFVGSRMHDAIPFGLGGDFETFTAPYDPLFFLHYTQLDCLWWLWQQRQPEKGLLAYSGHKHGHSMEMSSLDDTINMQGLAPNVKIRDVMDVEGELLCYTY
ncbi:hypothetical protein LTR62_008575 [Meristemomyces frigidus]|uniref:Tyrosinase copper-binding domain-containing protein n=1 Tax=Meristemomyces frigidus TaxID=1508187 RepID=A0AAN7TUP1_9PEZI|nr:hypothetical protein LTR62_008575 [Meristemomyces frigidus]